MSCDYIHQFVWERFTESGGSVTGTDRVMRGEKTNYEFY